MRKERQRLQQPPSVSFLRTKEGRGSGVRKGRGSGVRKWVFSHSDRKKSRKSADGSRGGEPAQEDLGAGLVGFCSSFRLDTAPLLICPVPFCFSFLPRFMAEISAA